MFHCGFCYEVIPGANDNASGMAVMLGVAEALAKNPVKPKRSILLIGFGSKEQAHRGAQRYLKNPLFPRNKTVIFFNLDMVGCGDQIKALGGLDYPDLWQFISRANKKTRNALLEPAAHSSWGWPQYDADLFLAKKIPCIVFSAHGAPTYPRTTKDTVDTITPQIMKDLTRIIFQATLDLANTDFDFFPPE